MNEQLTLFDEAEYCPDIINQIYSFEDILRFARDNGLKVDDNIHDSCRSVKVYKPSKQSWYDAWSFNDTSNNSPIESCSYGFNLGGSSFYCATKNEYVDETLYCIEGGRVGLRVVDHKHNKFKEDIFAYHGGKQKVNEGWCSINELQSY